MGQRFVSDIIRDLSVHIARQHLSVSIEMTTLSLDVDPHGHTLWREACLITEAAPPTMSPIPWENKGERRLKQVQPGKEETLDFEDGLQDAKSSEQSAFSTAEMNPKEKKFHLEKMTKRSALSNHHLLLSSKLRALKYACAAGNTRLHFPGQARSPRSCQRSEARHARKLMANG
ncbi:unnamed protein product [Leuciscus chuanchicus]